VGMAFCKLLGPDIHCGTQADELMDDSKHLMRSVQGIEAEISDETRRISRTKEGSPWQLLLLNLGIYT
jgi:hypothetical protein